MTHSAVVLLQVALGGILTAAAVILWFPALSELLCVLKRKGVSIGTSPCDETPLLLFLVPAHNEELLITGCVRSLLDLTYPEEARRVVVIADNCTDATAALATEQGADVLERFDAALPGKPRAIAWALGRVDLKEWDACIVIDADSKVAPDFGVGVARLAPLNDAIFQANFGVLNEFDNWLTRLGGLLSRCRYEITYPLKQSAGLNCPVTGNGMGFGTNLLMRDGWRAFSIAEDSELYAIYTEAGVRIRHADGATLFSQEARSLNQGATQRRRWIGGRLRVIRNWGIKLIRSSNISWHQKLDALVELGLSTPVLHLLAAVAVMAVALFALPAKPGQWIAVLAGASLVSVVVTTVTAIWRHPQPWRTVSSLLMLPVYAFWRLAVLLLTLFTLRDTTWRRSKRTAPEIPLINPMGNSS